MEDFFSASFLSAEFAASISRNSGTPTMQYPREFDMTKFLYGFKNKNRTILTSSRQQKANLPNANSKTIKDKDKHRVKHKQENSKILKASRNNA